MRRAGRGDIAGFLVTLALHGAVLAAVGVAHSKPQAPVIEPRDFVMAEMVKLGKPREKFWLPRITQPPRPVAPPAEIKIADDPNAKPAPPPEAPRPEDPKISRDVKRALDRARKLQALAGPEEPEEGALDGSRLGTASQATGDPYLAEITALLQQNFAVPAGIAPEQIATPPEIRVRIQPDGRLTDVKLTKSSGNNFVDDACVQAAELTRQVKPPPPTIRGIRVACTK